MPLDEPRYWTAQAFQNGNEQARLTHTHTEIRETLQFATGVTAGDGRHVV